MNKPVNAPLPPPMACCDTPSCSQMMCKLINAYNEVLTNGGIQEVTIGDDTTRYHKNNIAALKAQIGALHQSCGTPLSAAILGISRRRQARGLCFDESHRCRTVC